MRFESIFNKYRPIFAKKAIRVAADGIAVISGKWGDIQPDNLEGTVFCASGTDLKRSRVSAICRRLEPLCFYVEGLQGDFSALFHSEQLLEVAKVIGVRRRGTQGRNLVKPQVEPINEVDNRRNPAGRPPTMGMTGRRGNHV